MNLIFPLSETGVYNLIQFLFSKNFYSPLLNTVSIPMALSFIKDKELNLYFNTYPIGVVKRNPNSNEIIVSINSLDST